MIDDKVTVEDNRVLAQIISSGILDKYRLSDQYLDKFLSQIVNASVSGYQDEIEIGIVAVPSEEIESIHRSRLTLIIEAKSSSNGNSQQVESDNVELATRQLLDYCTNNSGATIMGVGIHCLKHSYAVFCGKSDKGIEVICEM
jgi:hypothetical protein